MTFVTLGPELYVLLYIAIYSNKISFESEIQNCI